MTMWEDLAACAGMDTGMFFSQERQERAMARETCTGCPVRRACLSYAIESDQAGIWGGTDTAERKKYARDHDLTPWRQEEK